MKQVRNTYRFLGDTIWLLGLVLFMIVIFGGPIKAQETVSDSLKLVVEQLVDKELENKLEWLYWLFGFSVAGFSILGILLWFWRVKNVASKLIREKVNKLVEDQISERTGVKADILREILQEQASQKEIRQKRIVILSKDKGRIRKLAEKFSSAGFKEFEFLGHEELGGLDTNGVALILINNDKDEKEEQFSKDELINIFDKFKDQVRLAYLGPQVDNEIFNKYKSIVKFTNVESYLMTNLAEALKN